MQRGRLRALRRVEIAVARAHRETVRLRAASRRLARATGKRKSSIMRSQQDDLLVVLLPEHEHVGRHDVQQPAHDRRDAVEMARPARAAELAAQRRQRDAHGVLETERVDLAHVGHEQQVDGAGRGETRGVVGERARISGEVFARSELRRIDEDARDDAVALASATSPRGSRGPSCRLPIVGTNATRLARRAPAPTAARTRPHVRTVRSAACSSMRATRSRGITSIGPSSEKVCFSAG